MEMTEIALRWLETHPQSGVLPIVLSVRPAWRLIGAWWFAHQKPSVRRDLIDLANAEPHRAPRR